MARSFRLYLRRGAIGAVPAWRELGGVGIVALYLQDKTGFKAGWTQLLFDLAVFALALALRDPVTVAWSFLGALILNMVIMMNHRRDRYIAT